MNRFLLYIHYNKSDELSGHVLYQLEQIRPLFSRVIFISNSHLDQNHIEKLEMIGIFEIIQRENIGFDFAAWRDGMKYVGFDHLEKYDSVTLMNDTCIGPLWDLKEYFEKFEKRVDVDFWGMTNFRKTKYFKEHLQSYFVSYSRQVVSSKIFQKFWTTIRDYETVRNVIDHYETRFTGKLTRSGFKYGVVFNTLNEDAGDLIHPDFSYYRPLIILQRHVPLLKIKAIQSHLTQKEQLKIEIINNTFYPPEILEEILSSLDYFSEENKDSEKPNFISKLIKEIRRRLGRKR